MLCKMIEGVVLGLACMLWFVVLLGIIFLLCNSIGFFSIPLIVNDCVAFYFCGIFKIEIKIVKKTPS